jgi:hypothetical protein
LKLWHRPTSQLQESQEKALGVCHVHIKCLKEKCVWMADGLDAILKDKIGLDKVRTIYGTDNQPELVPST